LQYEERLQRLARKLDMAPQPTANFQHLREQENYRDELELRLNALTEQFNSLSYKFDREL